MFDISYYNNSSSCSSQKLHWFKSSFGERVTVSMNKILTKKIHFISFSCIIFNPSFSTTCGPLYRQFSGFSVHIKTVSHMNLHYKIFISRKPPTSLFSLSVLLAANLMKFAVLTLKMILVEYLLLMYCSQ